jgi:hypothetical protein
LTVVAKVKNATVRHDLLALSSVQIRKWRPDNPRGITWRFSANVAIRSPCRNPLTYCTLSSQQFVEAAACHPCCFYTIIPGALAITLQDHLNLQIRFALCSKKPVFHGFRVLGGSGSRGI